MSRVILFYDQVPIDHPFQETPPPPPPPPPKINPAFSKEVEFRGYFLLKGIPHFCIFNKKSNFGEWIKLTEKTEEEFEAQAFDLESETLTLAFSGQTFDLTLINPTPYNSPASPNKPTGSTKQSTGSGSKTTGSQPKIMPPKPDRVPQLPSWLTSRMSNRLNSPADSTGWVKHPKQSLWKPLHSSPLTNFQLDPKFNSFTSSSSSGSASLVRSVDSPDGVALTTGANVELSEGEESTTSTVEELDLEGLPPPPPPPNILPPSGPPNLIPSRDD